MRRAEGGERREDAEGGCGGRRAEGGGRMRRADAEGGCGLR